MYGKVHKDTVACVEISLGVSTELPASYQVQNTLCIMYKQSYTSIIVVIPSLINCFNLFIKA